MNRSLTLALALVKLTGTAFSNNSGSIGTVGNIRSQTSAVLMQPGAIVGSSDTSIQVNSSDALQTSVEYTPLLNPAGDWSSEIWVNPTEIPGQLSCPFSSGNFSDPRSGWLLYMDNANGWSFRGYQNVGLATAFNITTATGPPTAGHWYHLVMTWQSATGTARLYVNGSLAGEQTGVTNFVAASAVGAMSSGRLHFGSRADGAFGWSGYADEAAVYATTLTASEVLSHYENGTNPARTKPYDVLVQESLPLGYWRLNQMTFDPTLPPTVFIQSAAMRGSTGLMDVVFRINDPDDATVKTRALAFIDGQRSFAKLIKPTTFAEGTAIKIGDVIATNTDHTLTWDVGADWNIDLGQIKFEILAMDGRGLLPLNWVTIPAANGEPELTISKNAPSDQEVLNALFWQYASGDPGLTLENGLLRGTAASGVYSGERMANGSSIQFHGPLYVFHLMHAAPAESVELNRSIASRAMISEPTRSHASLPYMEPDMLTMWGRNLNGQAEQPAVFWRNYESIDAGESHNLALRSNGTIVAWGSNQFGQINVPDSLLNVTSVSAGQNHNLAVKSEGTVVGWGSNSHKQIVIPAGLNDVVSVSAGHIHSIALKSDGTVVSWGAENNPGVADVPSGLSDVKAISAGYIHSLALKNDGTVVAWGASNEELWDYIGMAIVPAGLSSIKAIDAGTWHNLALKNDGTVVAWGANYSGETDVPSGLSNVVSISAGNGYSLALRSDGTVVAWGSNYWGERSVPSSLSGVSAIAAGSQHAIALKKAP
jgi:hypothetical protein